MASRRTGPNPPFSHPGGRAPAAFHSLRSALDRALRPLEGLPGWLLLVWSGLVALLWSFGIGDEQIAGAVTHPDLRAALTVVARAADAVWLCLAACEVYLALAAREGLAAARRSSLLILGAGGMVAACSAWRGFPLGHVFYTRSLGPKFGPVPLGWPLLWLVVVAGGRDLAARLRPRWSPAQLAVATGALALLTDWSLEPLATKVRLFWFWTARPAHLPIPPPLQNFGTWSLGAWLLALVLRERTVAASVASGCRAARVFLLLNAVFLLGNLGRLLRGG